MKPKYRAFMKDGRYGFGACTSKLGKFIVVVGGAKSSYIHRAECEYYHTKKNAWYSLPKLNSAKYSQSVVDVEGKFIYAFGGGQFILEKEKNDCVSDIEKLNFFSTRL